MLLILIQKIAAEMAYWMKNVMPYTEKNDGNVRWWRMKGAGQNWNNDMPPARFIKMTTYNLKRGKSSDFFRFWSNNVKLQKSLVILELAEYLCFKVVVKHSKLWK